MVDTVQLGEIGNQQDFALVFKTYFNAEKDGIYEFELKSDGESLFYLNDVIVIDKTGKDWLPFRKNSKVALKKGWHPFMVVYKPGKKPRAIELRYAEQGKELRLMDQSVCRY